VSRYILPGKKLLKTIMLDLYNRDTPTDIDSLYNALFHVTSIFPSNTNLTCTLTAAAGANTWSSWVELEDSGSNTMTTLFATYDGHISSMLVETISEKNTIYMAEVSYGSANTVVVRARFAGETKFQAPNVQNRFWAPVFAAGETVYYRMKTATAVADTCTVHFRYHLH